MALYLGSSEKLKITSHTVIKTTDKVIKPLTVTENGEYVGGEENGKQVAYSPVTVDVHGIQALIDFRKSASFLFHCNWGVTLGEGYTEEVYRLLKGIDTSSVTSTTQMFHICESLTSVPLFDTRNVTTAEQMFQFCISLTVVPAFDMSKCNNLYLFVLGCQNLTECWIKNIKASLQVGSGTEWGHLLTLESLIHLIYELRDTGSSLILTVGSANLEKLANVYVRAIDITDEMRAEDDLIDEKLPFEVCESTDEGACLISEYVYFKNWELR